VTGIPKTLEINSEEVREALDESINTNHRLPFGLTLEGTPPELRRILWTKGSRWWAGVRSSKTWTFSSARLRPSNLRLVDDPLSAVVLGAGMVLDNREIASCRDHPILKIDVDTRSKPRDKQELFLSTRSHLL